MINDEGNKAIEELKSFINDKDCIYWIGKNGEEAVKIILNLIESQQKEINKLKQENHNLKQELKVYIPRRRVRRVYKMIGKILKQDGVTDDLDELLEE